MRGVDKGFVIEQLNREHPEYRDRKEVWQRYWDFYVGGEQLRRNASHYMVRRQKEPNDVYAERLSRVFYENWGGMHIGGDMHLTPEAPTYSMRAHGGLPADAGGV